MIELLSPAGTYDKMVMAFSFGADAVYVAGQKFGLRAFAGNFDEQELKKASDYAHSLNKKIYVTLNILAHEDDFEGLSDYIKYLDEIKIDAVIFSDVGIIDLCRTVAPN